MSLARRFGGLTVAVAIAVAAWPAPIAPATDGGPSTPPAATPDESATAPAPSPARPSLVVTPGTPSSTPPAPSPAGRLAFAEECNGPRLNRAWSALYVVGDAGHGLDSDFLGDLRQVSVANGTCTITATRSSTPSGRPYASAAMGTRGRFSQAFGTFEARVRYGTGEGLWPAFWLLEDGESVRTPPEIDIFEAYPSRAGGIGGAEVVVSTLHARGGSSHLTHDAGEDLTGEFHVHRLDWSPGLLVFSLDGVETGRIARDVPDVPMYPILNLAVGADGYRADSSTPDVATLEIDYVRVWAP